MRFSLSWQTFLLARERKALMAQAFLLVGMVVTSAWIAARHPLDESFDLVGAFFYGFCVIGLWFSALGQAARQALTAWELCLPGMTGAALAALGAQGAAIVFFPLLLIGLYGLLASAALLLLNLCLVMGTVVALPLPDRLAGVPFDKRIGLLLPALPCLLSYLGLFPGVRDPQFLVAGPGVAALFAGAIAWLYRPAFDRRRRIGLIRELFARGSIETTASFEGSDGGEFASVVLPGTPAPGHHAMVRPSAVAAIKTFLGPEYSARTWKKDVLVTVAFNSMLVIGMMILGNSKIFILCLTMNQIILGERDKFVMPISRAFGGRQVSLDVFSVLPGFSGAGVKMDLIQAIFRPMLVLCFSNFLSLLMIYYLEQRYYGSQNGLDGAPSIVFVLIFSIGCYIVLFSSIFSSLVGKITSRFIDTILFLLPFLFALFLEFASARSTSGERFTLLAMGLVYAVPVARRIISAGLEFRRRPHPFLQVDRGS